MRDARKISIKLEDYEVINLAIEAHGRTWDFDIVAMKTTYHNARVQKDFYPGVVAFRANDLEVEFVDFFDDIVFAQDKLQLSRLSSEKPE